VQVLWRERDWRYGLRIRALRGVVFQQPQFNKKGFLNRNRTETAWKIPKPRLRLTAKTAQFYNSFKLFVGSVVNGKFNECVCAC